MTIELSFFVLLVVATAWWLAAIDREILELIQELSKDVNIDELSAETSFEPHKWITRKNAD